MRAPGSAAYRRVMGIYGNRVLPHIIDKACGMKSNRPLRERVCADLYGDVVEVGFGSGNNVDFYPAAITKVTAIEPSDTAWRMAGKRLEGSRVPVERSGLDGQRLPFADQTFDAALSTWTICTIPDAVVALEELRRVLRPGGMLHFVEHGLAPDAKVQRWQHRFNGMQQRCFGGCNLNRPIVEMIEQAGFRVTDVDVFYEKGAPKFIAAESLGTAVVG
jgi:ubiquinone/menaquinone biosynthesis C-methylase UbiE